MMKYLLSFFKLPEIIHNQSLIYNTGLTENMGIPSITPSGVVDIYGIYRLSRLHKLTVYATVRKSYNIELTQF